MWDRPQGLSCANCCLTRRCTLRGRVAQMSGAELGFASIRCMSIREATTADFRSEIFPFAHLSPDRSTQRSTTPHRLPMAVLKPHRKAR